MKDKNNEIYTCCLCGEVFEGWGNNPWPLNKDADARCCDACNDLKVIPARLQGIINRSV